MIKNQVPARVNWIISAVVAACVAVSILPYIMLSIPELTAKGIFLDDTFFYAVIAKNINAGAIASLDGEMLTNGFQPLWMLIVLSVGKLFPNQDLMSVISLLSWGFYVALAFVLSFYSVALMNGHKHFSILGPVICLALLLQPGFQKIVMKGLEIPLELFLIVLLLIQIHMISTKNKYESSPATALIGITTGLLFLARTDMFWGGIISGLFLLKKNKYSVIRVLPMAIAASMLVIPYLLYNFLNFGHLMPISGRVKRYYLDVSYPSITSYITSPEWRGLPTAISQGLSIEEFTQKNSISYVISFSFLLLCVCIGYKLHKKKQLSESEYFLYSLTFLHVFFMYFFYRELRDYTSYYFSYVFLFFIVVIVRVLPNTAIFSVKNGLSKLSTVSIILISVQLVSAWGISDRYKDVSYWQERINIAADIDQRIPPEEKVGAFWPGLFSYMSQRTIHPLDGIAGSEDYFESTIKQADEFNYMRKNKIRHLVIFLNTDLESFYLAAPPPKSDWANRGAFLLWHEKEHRPSIVASRRVEGKIAGYWYILRFDKWQELDS